MEPRDMSKADTIGDVDVRGLSNEERLVVAFLTLVDPAHYDGADPAACLVGQTAEALELPSFSQMDRPLRLAHAFHLDYHDIRDIFLEVSTTYYHHSPARSIIYAARKLGLTPAQLNKFRALASSEKTS